MKTFDYKNAAENLKRLNINEPLKITIYTTNVSVAQSGMSAIIKAYIVHDNEIYCIGQGRVHGCGLDRGHECASNIFYYAFPKRNYQDSLVHRWI